MTTNLTICGTVIAKDVQFQTVRDDNGEIHYLSDFNGQRDNNANVGDRVILTYVSSASYGGWHARKLLK